MAFITKHEEIPPVAVKRYDGFVPVDPKMAAVVQEAVAAAPTVGAFRPAEARQFSAKPIGREQIAKAVAELQRYKQGKAALEQRLMEDELWWELRHWEAIGRNDGSRAKKIADGTPQPTSGWLFNSIMNKHADAMDNYPEPLALPREKSDIESAKALSSVLPVILEYNDFEQTYSNQWWEKLKHGTGSYGVFWNPQVENGLGDVDIQELDLMNLFWEPGITDIQDSRNLFIVSMEDEDILEEQYPEFKGHLRGNAVDVKQYLYDDQVDLSGKSVVVDWYYKKRNHVGRTVLHYAKFVTEDSILYASENDPEYAERGWYDDGEYPVVLDVLFPEKGTPVGFGYVSICKDPQLYIDKLYANILENAMMGTKKRFFVSESTAINEQEFLDWTKPLVHVAGELDERRIQEIVTQPLPTIYANILEMKIAEMKETSANQDVNSGNAGSGVTAAAAIAALQEAGNKSSRDMISASYRAHVKINRMATERMRQFYTETRSFRIVGNTPEGYEFVELSNAKLREQPVPPLYPGQENEPDYEPMFRKPIFDIKIQAQKKNPFSRMEQNERAKELYGLGFFNPERAQEAQCALDMMDFEGIDKVRESVAQGQTMLNLVKQMQQQMQQMALIIQQLTGGSVGAESPSATQGKGGSSAPSSAAPSRSKNDLAGGVTQAQTPMTSYGQGLAKRSAPDMNAGSNAAAPGM